MIRIALGLFLLAVALYAGWLSTYLLDPGFFRTEGSPAGAGLFVVFLGFPVIALASAIGGVALLLSGWRSRDAAAAAPHRAATRTATVIVESRRARSADGSVLDVLIHGDLAVVWMRRADGSGMRSHNARRHGEGTYFPFRSTDGSPIRLPSQWTVPAALARQAAADFESARDWTRRLGTAPTPAVPVEFRDGDDRSRWSWLISAP